MSSVVTTRPTTSGSGPASGQPRSRPVVLLASIAALTASVGPLIVVQALGVIGWFLADAGVHGTPRSGMRMGALAWLMGHGSGIHVYGTSITVLPLGLTLVSAWVIWRVGVRLGESVSGRGPDAARLTDGERDLTVPAAVSAFVLTYLVVIVVVWSLAADPESNPSMGRATFGALALTLLVGGPAIASGSGRLAVRASWWPPAFRHAVHVGATAVSWVLMASTALVLICLVANWSTAADSMAQLHTDVGESLFFGVVNLAVLPNAALCAASWLLGPGFSVGVGTLVSPSVVSTGPLPLLPLLAALPDPATPSAVWQAVPLVPGLLAAAAAVRVQRRYPTLRWDQGALRGCGGGMLAGAVLWILLSLAGGAAGPGRLRDVGPLVTQSGLYAVVICGVGGLLGGLAVTWWQRRTSEPA